jgi:hypothetical protein
MKAPGPVPAVGGAFEVFPVVVDSYAHLPALPEAARVAEEVTNLFAELGGVTSPWPKETVPGHDAVTERLAQWSTPAAPRSSVLLWFGHGESDGSTGWLAVHGSREPMSGSGTALNAVTFAEHLTREWVHRAPDPAAWTLVVIEACGAATFVRNLARELYSSDLAPDRIALVGVGADGGQAHLGEFAQALRQTLASYSELDTRIRISDLIARLRGWLPGRAIETDFSGAAEVVRAGLPAVPAGTTADEFAELRAALRALPDDQQVHFVPRAQGGERGEISWYFTGRAGEQLRIADWLRRSATSDDAGDGSGMLVVTGRPGSGKSALLGQVLVQSDPILRRLLATSGLSPELPQRQRPPDNTFDAVIHLTGVTVSQLLHRLHAALDAVETDKTGSGDEGWPVAPAEHGSSVEVERLLARLGGFPFTVLLDALDEAVEPVAVASSVLRRLARVPGCRLVVGTRPTSSAGVDDAPAAEDILDSLGRADVLHVRRDPAAAEGYVRARLTALRAAGQGSGRFTDDVVAGVARLVRDQGREFLFARLAVHEIAARPMLVEASRRPALEALLAGDHRDLFAHAVARLGGLADAHEPLLYALALARGRGMPRAERVWASAAGALAPAGVRIGDREINRLLADAAPYIMLDAEHGQTVYRLAHRTFQEHFLNAPARTRQPGGM